MLAALELSNELAMLADIEKEFKVQESAPRHDDACPAARVYLCIHCSHPVERLLVIENTKSISVELLSCINYNVLVFSVSKYKTFMQNNDCKFTVQPYTVLQMLYNN